MSEELCPLCGAAVTAEYHRDKRRQYLGCGVCSLVFVPSCFHLSAEEERTEYDLHENDLYDKGYRRFLSRVYGPVSERLKPESRGLDFGCGPGPALALMFEEAGFSMDVYDKFYAPDESVWSRTYDFITTTEVIEHIGNPAEVLPRLRGILKPGGIMGIMTKLVKSPEAFSVWHYTHDPTHICFYSRQTFRWLAGFLEMKTEFIGNDVILLS